MMHGVWMKQDNSVNDDATTNYLIEKFESLNECSPQMYNIFGFGLHKIRMFWLFVQT